MLPKICFVCNGQMAEMVKKEYNRLDVPAQLIIYDNLMKEDTVLPDYFKDIDVFLSSGLNGYMLKKKVKQPVVIMDIRIPDIMKAVYDAMRYDSSPLIVPFNEKFSCVDLINDISSLKLEQRPFRTREELWDIMVKYKEQGGRAIVGTALGCEYAEQLGMKGFFIRPFEQLINSINTAVDVAVALKTETVKNVELMTVINYFDRGVIITTDGAISICNAQAARIFAYIGKPIVDMPTDELLKHFEYESETDSENLKSITSPIRNLVCTINSNKYLVDFIPINYGNDIVGTMINFNSLERIENAREFVHNDLKNKGFVAKHYFKDMSAESAKFKRVVSVAQRYSQTEESIVILGETGVGKEVMASAIHNNSRRASNPFIAVNCSAMNEKLLESELFGYEEGAFTGAKRGGKKGIFELADKGTIFLDEIGEIDEAIQIKLLRAIQEKEIMRVGGTKIIHFDARIICATNKDLWSLVEEKKFREDLYYRLNVLELTIPPLRERQEDVYALFKRFLTREVPTAVRKLNAAEGEVAALLNTYNWPGNIRELDNFTKTLAATLESGFTTNSLLNAMSEILKSRIDRIKAKPEMLTTNEIGNVFLQKGTLPSKQEREKAEIERALFIANGNRTKAAEMLEMSRATLWKKMKSYEIE